jgi:hypothetical protein
MIKVRSLNGCYRSRLNQAESLITTVAGGQPQSKECYCLQSYKHGPVAARRLMWASLPIAALLLPLFCTTDPEDCCCSVAQQHRLCKAAAVVQVRHPRAAAAVPASDVNSAALLLQGSWEQAGNSATKLSLPLLLPG